MSIVGFERANQDDLAHLERIERVVSMWRGSTESFSLEDMAEMAYLSPFISSASSSA